jgi:hypothetical protein
METLKLINEDDGSVYEGESLNGKPHGKGKMTYADGRVEEGRWKKGIKINNIIKYEQMKKINSITLYSHSCWDVGDKTIKIINNGEKTMCEYFIDEKLERTLEIGQEVLHTLINKLFKIIKQRNYFWNKHYSINGDEFVFDVSPWEIEIKNETGQCIEIKFKGSCKCPEIFSDFLTIIWDIYYDKIESKNK